MGESRLTDVDIGSVLQEGDSGTSLDELCARHGISESELNDWWVRREKDVAALERRVRELEEENMRLRSLVADLTLRNEALKKVMSKKP